ncbi:MAG TPA: hypothetical protein VGY96_18695 [Streptosporangiaceae bacterium]|nr:hypothetical protein [Streptosporangiaceae bacterium]
MKHFKLGIVLALVTIVLSLGWAYLPHLLFAIFLASVAIIVLASAASYNSWRQVGRIGQSAPAPPRVSGIRPMPQVRVRPASQTRAKRRAERRTELLQPDATVTLSDERSTAGIDDIFTALNNELVGLVPVKKKVEEIASLLLVDRVRQKFGLSAPRPNLHMCSPARREPGRPLSHCRWLICCTAWATWNRDISSMPCAMTWWGNLSGTPRPRQSASSTAPWAGLVHR